MQVEVKFPCDPESVKARPFVPEISLQREGEQIEIVLVNKHGYAYAWATVSVDQFKEALSALNLKE